jgi:hypothetical protein
MRTFHAKATRNLWWLASISAVAGPSGDPIPFSRTDPGDSRVAHLRPTRSGTSQAQPAQADRTDGTSRADPGRKIVGIRAAGRDPLEQDAEEALGLGRAPGPGHAGDEGQKLGDIQVPAGRAGGLGRGQKRAAGVEERLVPGRELRRHAAA